MITLGRYPIGVGDRFAHQAEAQLRACMLALNAGVQVIPVWNKSNREHTIIGSEPSSVRAAADAAVTSLGWKLPYFCDADHINLSTVDRFLPACDFYTIDVADCIGKLADEQSINRFVRSHPELNGRLPARPGSDAIDMTPQLVRSTAAKFLVAIQKAGKVYRYIEERKGKGSFIPEISMDETDAAQSPAELLIILAAIADAGIPIQTIAPKFSGRFNKGVDYVGNTAQFANEIVSDIAAIQHAIEIYGLPSNLKLSIHSGSDKFSIYPAIHAAMQQLSAGVHLKTAGTTWLEEVIGLAEAGGEGLDLAKEIYAEAFEHATELCAPYSTVIDIDPGQLPNPAQVQGWTSAQFTAALRHNPASASYNSSLRQLLHVAFKVAARLGSNYTTLIESNQNIIAKNVTHNLYARHMAPVFLGESLGPSA
jgi:tagaturonate epimerase